VYTFLFGEDMKATAKDLRFHSRRILEAVERGEEVIITYRGKPRARILPIDTNPESGNEKNNLFGIWKDNDKSIDVDNYIRNLRQGRF
jgi:prevent-host-death family protein